MIQSFSIAFYLKRALFDWDIYLAGQIIIWLTTGAMIVLWLSEIVTEYGLGNGASLLIYTNIVSNLPNFGKNLFLKRVKIFRLFHGYYWSFTFYCNLWNCFITGRDSSCSINFIKTINKNNRIIFNSSLLENNYIPLRFNQAGVMPIILTTAVLVIPNYISNLGLLPFLTLPAFFNHQKLFIGLVILF